MARVPVVLTIAGFDPSSGAGATADLKTIAAHEMFGVACITSLTVQSTQGVRRSEAVSAKLVGDTLGCLAEDVEFAAIKIGMLANAEIVRVVADFLRAMGPKRPPIVLDPVAMSSSEAELLDSAGLRLMRTDLLALVDWVAPNAEELGLLLQEPTPAREEIPQAALRLRMAAGGRLNVVVTNGHLAKPDDYLLASADIAADPVADPVAVPGAAGTLQEWLEGQRVETTSTHGTGCAFSTALACCLARGDAPLAAAQSAKRYVAQALGQAYPVGKGRGPMHHLWRSQGGEDNS